MLRTISPRQLTVLAAASLMTIGLVASQAGAALPSKTVPPKQWAKKVPLGKGVKLEVRRVSETEEFPQDNPWIEKEIQWRADLAEKAAEQARKAAGR